MSAILNNKALRNLNKVELMTLTQGSMSPTVMFSGYTNSGPSLDLNIHIEDLFKSAQNMLGTGVGGFIGQQILGISGGIDVATKYLFSGTDPIEFTIDGFIPVENGFEEDVLIPVQNLLNYILPSRGDKKINDVVLGKIDNLKQEAKEKGHSGALWNAVYDALDTVSNYIGDIYNLEVPEQMKNNISVMAEDDGVKHSDTNQIGMNLYWGPMVFNDVIVTGFSLKNPQTFMVETDINGNVIGPCPDSVNFTLKVKTNRRATTQSIQMKRLYKR